MTFNYIDRDSIQNVFNYVMFPLTTISRYARGGGDHEFSRVERTWSECG